ncbi:MAG: hypothetical protein WC340_14210 [Kiritimatiellia bacterium]
MADRLASGGILFSEGCKEDITVGCSFVIVGDIDGAIGALLSIRVRDSGALIQQQPSTPAYAVVF